MLLSKKFGYTYNFLSYFMPFSDEINFEKFKKVVKNLIGVKIQTPVTLTFFMINPN